MNVLIKIAAICKTSLTVRLVTKSISELSLLHFFRTTLKQLFLYLMVLIRLDNQSLTIQIRVLNRSDLQIQQCFIDSIELAVLIQPYHLVLMFTKLKYLITKAMCSIQIYKLVHYDFLFFIFHHLLLLSIIVINSISIDSSSRIRMANIGIRDRTKSSMNSWFDKVVILVIELMSVHELVHLVEWIGNVSRMFFIFVHIDRLSFD